MSFPEQLKKARMEIGYTQQQIADLMGITKSTYCGYETGKRQPDVLKIKQLASILNTSGDVLLETNFINKENNSPKSEIIKKLEKMSDREVEAVMAFVDSLEGVQAIFQPKEKE